MGKNEEGRAKLKRYKNETAKNQNIVYRRTKDVEHKCNRFLWIQLG